MSTWWDITTVETMTDEEAQRADDALAYLRMQVGLSASQIASAAGMRQAHVRAAAARGVRDGLPSPPEQGAAAVVRLAGLWERLAAQGLGPGSHLVEGLTVDHVLHGARRVDLLERIADGEPSCEVLDEALPGWRAMLVDRGVRVVDMPGDSAVPGSGPVRAVVVDGPVDRVMRALRLN